MIKKIGNEKKQKWVGCRLDEEEYNIFKRNVLFSGSNNPTDFIRNSIIEQPISLKDMANDIAQSKLILEKLETTVELNKRLLYILLQNDYLTFNLAAQTLVEQCEDKEKVNAFVEIIRKEALAKYNETKNF